MKYNIIEKKCPCCGARAELALNAPEYENFLDYKKGGFIQEKMTTLNAVEREFLKTGYCPRCQEMIFGNGKTERVKL